MCVLMFKVCECVNLLPGAVQMMRDDELCASTILSNNDSAAIA